MFNAQLFIHWTHTHTLYIFNPIKIDYYTLKCFQNLRYAGVMRPIQIKYPVWICSRSMNNDPNRLKYIEKRQNKKIYEKISFVAILIWMRNGTGRENIQNHFCSKKIFGVYFRTVYWGHNRNNYKCTWRVAQI